MGELFEILNLKRIGGRLAYKIAGEGLAHERTNTRPAWRARVIAGVGWRRGARVRRPLRRRLRQLRAKHVGGGAGGRHLAERGECGARWRAAGSGRAVL